MTVRELIDKLKDIPGDTEVVFWDRTGEYGERQVKDVDYLDCFNEVLLS
jgi:hypothetical protein